MPGYSRAARRPRTVRRQIDDAMRGRADGHRADHTGGHIF